MSEAVKGNLKFRQKEPDWFIEVLKNDNFIGTLLMDGDLHDFESYDVPYCLSPNELRTIADRLEPQCAYVLHEKADDYHGGNRIVGIYSDESVAEQMKTKMELKAKEGTCSQCGHLPTYIIEPFVMG